MTLAHGSGRVLIEVMLTPKTSVDMIRVTGELVAGLPGCAVRFEPNAGRFMVGGADEAQIERIVTIVTRLCPSLEIGRPRIAYLETLGARVEKDHTFKKQAHGRGQFARVKFACQPGARGSGNIFVNAVQGGAVPDAFIAGVEGGITEALDAGAVAGFPVVDVHTTLVDGAYHDEDSSPESFAIASRGAIREVLADGRSVLLEPVLSVEVRTPAAYVGAITGDLVARRGVLVDQRGSDPIILEAHVPLCNLFGYASQLKSLSGGDATHTMTFAKYQPIPGPGDDPPPAAAMALRG